MAKPCGGSSELRLVLGRRRGVDSGCACLLEVGLRLSGPATRRSNVWPYLVSPISMDFEHDTSVAEPSCEVSQLQLWVPLPESRTVRVICGAGCQRKTELTNV